MSVMKALTRSRNLRAADDVPLTPGSKSLWLVTRERNVGGALPGAISGRVLDDFHSFRKPSRLPDTKRTRYQRHAENVNENATFGASDPLIYNLVKAKWPAI